LEMIEQGAKQLLEVITSTNDKVDQETKQKAQNLYFEIITSGFEWQRSGRVEEIARKEDEEMRERARSTNSHLTKEDYNQIIKSLRVQMLTAAKNEEYNRADQFKKRINELMADRDQIPHEDSEEIKVNQ